MTRSKKILSILMSLVMIDTLGVFCVSAQGSADIIKSELVGTFCLFYQFLCHL